MSTKNPTFSDVLYIEPLIGKETVTTVPDDTLKAFADHGQVKDALSLDGCDCETVLTSFAKAGIDNRSLAQRLQDDGAASFVKSWTDLLVCIRSKRAALQRAS